jgi:hypothetical protein
MDKIQAREISTKLALDPYRTIDTQMGKNLTSSAVILVSLDTKIDTIDSKLKLTSVNHHHEKNPQKNKQNQTNLNTGVR